MGREGGQVLEGLQRLAAALGLRERMPGEKLLQEAGLALRGHAEDPQVPRLHPVRGELERRLHHLPVGLVEPSPMRPPTSPYSSSARSRPGSAPVARISSK